METKEDSESAADGIFIVPRRSRIGLDFVKANETRKLGKVKGSCTDFPLQAFAEEKLVKKEYKEMKCEIPGTPRSTFLMVFSPDGTKLASTHGNHNIYITDVRTGKNIRTLVGHPRTPWCIAFHPTSNQIVASGCLGGQVRIWDLSGGSEVWTASSGSVIASIAFHPNDRVLVIATCNEVYFWDWSKPEPFVHTATNNPREKVRYVAFDKLGHKLITGIANSPQTRWERVRAPVPVPRQAERSASPYRRRITPRFIVNMSNINSPTDVQEPVVERSALRSSLSDVTERERRISASYRNLVQEYELLVHRYMQVYQPPAMIDRGTDPMDSNLLGFANNTPTPSTSTAAPSEPSTSTAPPEPPARPGNPLIRICSLRFPPLRLIRGTQTGRESENQQTEASQDQDQEVPQQEENERSSRRTLNLPSSGEPQPSTSGTQPPESPPLTIKCSPKKKTRPVPTVAQQKAYGACIMEMINKRLKNSNDGEMTAQENVTGESGEASTAKRPHLDAPSTTSDSPSTSAGPRRTARHEMDRPDLMRLFRHHKQQNLMKPRFKRLNYGQPKKGSRKRTLGSSSDSTSTDEDDRAKRTNRNRFAQSETTNQPSTSQETQQTEPSPSAPTPSAATTSNTSSSSNFNMILEHLVTNLLTDSSSNSNGTGSASSGSIGEQREAQQMTGTANHCARTSPQYSRSWSFDATRSTGSPSSSMPPSVGYGSRAGSAFHRIQENYRRRGINDGTMGQQSARRRYGYSDSSEMIDLDRMFSGLTSVNANPPPDEVINYSERVSSDDDPFEREFLHFEPTAELPTISPENIGIGNMYLNIVQDLESSLNDVRLIRASNRPGETSDMLSSFSERLESIMNQSDTILRNLRHSMDMLTTNQRSPSEMEQSYEDNFYMRERNGSDNANEPSSSRVIEYDHRSPQYVNFSSRESYNPLTSDHTYPRNPNNTSDNMTPLMTSLHLTISHIQRQASLLRRQVESIERIDRAMLEVAQVQIIRQLFVDIYSYLNNVTGNSDSRTAGVSNVRQMMAGTRISDPQPYDSTSEEQPSQNTSSEPEPGPSTSRADSSRLRQGRARNARKTYPPSKFLRMQRQGRRTHLPNFFGKRYMPRDSRGIRRTPPRRLIGHRPSARANDTFSRMAYVLSPDVLRSMTRRLVLLLMDQTRFFGIVDYDDGFGTETVTSNLENTVLTTLIRCRERMNRLMGLPANFVQTPISVAVTSDGASRFKVRNILSVVIDTLTRFFDENTNLTLSPSIQNQMQGILSLSLLLSEILLLRIVDSIPPPTGMNLDPERENLTSRIDQMCSHMLQRRLGGQNHQLTRSLRLMRLTVRHATRALNQTYMARRNSMMSQRHNTRRELVDSIYRCIRNINELIRPVVPGANNDTAVNTDQDWNRALDDIIQRYTRNWEHNATNNSLNVETGEEMHNRFSQGSQNNNNNNGVTVSDDNDDNDDGGDYSRYNNDSSSDRPSAPLYRSNNVNLFNSNETTTGAGSSSTSQYSPSSSWNVPIVHVNDVPVSEPSSIFPPRYWTRQHRLSERLTDVRQMTGGGGLFRPRFLHPLYSGVNPFDADLDDAQREQIYDSDLMITTVTPNHRIQVWDVSTGTIPVISNPLNNVVVSDCKIHNDASVDIAADGTILVTLLPSGGYLNVTNKLGVYSLRWESLGQCLYSLSFEQNAVSVSLSPLSRFLVVGLASRRVTMIPSDKWTLARIFILDKGTSPIPFLPCVRQLDQTRDFRASNYKSVNCIRWLPFSGQGLVYATNTGQLIVLT